MEPSNRWLQGLVLIVLLVGDIEAGRRIGGGRRSSSSSSSRSSSRSSWGSRSSSGRSSSSSSWGNTGNSGSYPRQQYTGGTSRTGGRGTNSGSSWGNTGNSGSYPRQQYGTGTSGNKGTALGGGGFVNPNRGGGGSYGSYGSRGGYGGVGGGSSYSYRSPGYGTNFGTSFTGGMGRYPVHGGNGFSKKALGLGVGAGFLGGAALGVAGTAAMYGVYHRYHQYQMMRMMMHGGGYHGYNHGYYNNYYSNNQCYGGCPMDAHCEWGFCECNRGLEKRYGRCERNWGGQTGRPTGFNPFQSCSNTGNCQTLDMNLVCNENLTTEHGGRCECRQDMKWNSDAGECQLYMDVDCSEITYDTKASPVILEAVNKTLEKIADNKTTTEVTTEANADLSGNDTTPMSSSPDEAMKNSLLASIDVNKTSEAELKEAFCRDIDSFSWEFGGPPQNQYDTIGYDNRRPTEGGVVAGGTLLLIILLICGLCCACCVCSAFKNKKKMSGVFRRSETEERPVTFTDINVNDAAGMGGGGGMGLHPNPGYKSEPTPQHTYSDTGVLYPGPGAIPPTQPGYTNYPGTEGATNPPAQPNPYPAAQPAAYPPAQGGIYPPIQAAYPPADGGLPYPVQPGNPTTAYPVQQQAYNPTAPP